mgnify:CR=1 FL=1
MVSGAEREGNRAPATICQGMDFGGWTPTRAPDGLNFRPPFPPCAERWARTAVLSSDLFGSARSLKEAIERIADGDAVLVGDFVDVPAAVASLLPHSYP